MSEENQKMRKFFLLFFYSLNCKFSHVAFMETSLQFKNDLEILKQVILTQLLRF